MTKNILFLTKPGRYCRNPDLTLWMKVLTNPFTANEQIRVHLASAALAIKGWQTGWCHPQFWSSWTSPKIPWSHWPWINPSGALEPNGLRLEPCSLLTVDIFQEVVKGSRSSPGHRMNKHILLQLEDQQHFLSKYWSRVTGEKKN